MAMVQCPECGKEISDQADVCINCGYSMKKARKKSAGKRILKVVRIVLPILIAVVVLFGVWKLLLPDLFTSADTFLARGDYQRAYEKTSNEDEKALLLIENQVAVACQDVIDSLKDPTSFSLSEAAYIENSQLLLAVVGRNSHGGSVTNYWVYDYEKDGAYEYETCLTDFEQEEYYDWEDASEQAEKAEDNLWKAKIQLQLYLGEYDFLPDENLQRINALFAAGKLNDVKLIPVIDPVETENPDATPIPEATDAPAATEAPAQP